MLFVEDSELDVELILRELGRIGYEVRHERVETAAQLGLALESGAWEVILSDYSLPVFDATGTLRVLAESGHDTPVIVISGTIDEEMAVGVLRAGASDFILKGRLSRLGPSIERALRERDARRKHRETERALRVSELRFRRLWEAGIIGITIADSAGAIVEANGTFLSMLGYSREDLDAGRLNWSILTPPELRPHHAVVVDQLRSGGAVGAWEKEYFHRDGSRVPVLVAVATLDESVNIALSLDLSSRKRLEEQFRQAQKMEAVGRLAGGVAHDFNNVLSVILCYATLLDDDLGPDDSHHEDVLEMKAAALRATDLTKQLLAFSRQQVLAPRTLNLNQIVSGMDGMLRRLLGEDVTIASLLGAGLWPMRADPSQVEQIVMNLVVNARDAMPTGGKLTIQTKNVELDEDYVRAHHGVTPGPYVMLAITDSGSGMNKEVQARVFEPFFTTKEKGKGTGLGLSTVFGIVSQSGGHIWLYSEPGQGTTFRIYFPREEGAAVLTLSAPPASEFRRGTETILLVEDEEQVRKVARGILHRNGYFVLEAASPGEALLVCEQHGAKIHLLVTDVVMPRMSGPQLVQRARASRPDMKVLFMSGYTDDAIVQHGLIDSDVPFLQKPITPESLARKVREALAATRPE